jgi:hypothetical protein
LRYAAANAPRLAFFAVAVEVRDGAVPCALALQHGSQHRRGRVDPDHVRVARQRGALAVRIVLPLRSVEDGTIRI